MRLQKMDNSRFAAYFICLDCGKRMVLSKAHPPIYADLDGEAYRAYYCPECSENKMHKAGFTDWQA